ncbi:MAG: TetR/AcrR family transcriptional regulator [Sphingopyxis sp.]|nr:TetR/AcrR family transcriptional regulator [Sphingopyxis sp.]
MSDPDIPGLKVSPREGGYARGQEGFELILNAALFVLATQGYKAMTLRAIAKECGMKSSNISYYFKSKNDIIRELMKAILDSYEYKANIAIESANGDPEEKLKNAILFIMTEGSDKEAVNIFPELWAMANHDDFVRERLDELYTRERTIFSGIISEINQDLSGGDRDIAATFILSSLEGLGLFAGHGKVWERSMPELQAIACDNFVKMVKTMKSGEEIGAVRRTGSRPIGLSKAVSVINRPEVWAAIERVASAALAAGGKLDSGQVEALGVISPVE